MCDGKERCNSCTRALVDAQPHGMTFGNVDIVEPKMPRRKLKDVPSPPPLGDIIAERLFGPIIDLMSANPFGGSHIRGTVAEKVAENEATGTCRVCGGVARPHFMYSGDFVLGGPPQPRSVARWACETCGIMYAKRPKPNGT